MRFPPFWTVLPLAAMITGVTTPWGNCRDQHTAIVTQRSDGLSWDSTSPESNLRTQVGRSLASRA